jgi:hypothetical protein
MIIIVISKSSDVKSPEKAKAVRDNDEGINVPTG